MWSLFLEILWNNAVQLECLCCIPTWRHKLDISSPVIPSVLSDFLLLYYNDILAMLISLPSFYLLRPTTFRFQLVKCLSTQTHPIHLLRLSYDSEGLAWSPRFCISNKFPENTDAMINCTQPWPRMSPIFPGVTTITWDQPLMTKVCLTSSFNSTHVWTVTHYVYIVTHIIPNSPPFLSNLSTKMFKMLFVCLL